MAFTRRAALFGAGAVAGAAGMRWLGPQNPTLAGNAVIASAGGAAVLNDASLMSETPVFRHVTMQRRSRRGAGGAAAGGTDGGAGRRPAGEHRRGAAFDGRPGDPARPATR